MKLPGNLGAVIAMLVGGAAAVGCNGNGARAKAPNDVFEIAQEELSHTIGAATLSSAEVAVQPKAKDPNPLYLNDEAEPAPARTWGSAPTEAQTAESDLAANPYASGTQAAPRDIYDPR
jgi:hypothetical protein